MTLIIAFLELDLGGFNASSNMYPFTRGYDDWDGV
jgi:hypothetical protein